MCQRRKDLRHQRARGAVDGQILELTAIVEVSADFLAELKRLAERLLARPARMSPGDQAGGTHAPSNRSPP